MVMGIEEGTEYLPYYLYFQDVTLCHDPGSLGRISIGSVLCCSFFHRANECSVLTHLWMWSFYIVDVSVAWGK